MFDKLENNTFIKEQKSNPKDRIEIEIGDSKQPDFKPQFKLMRWDNEVNFSIRAEEHPNATVEEDGKVIKYVTPKYEVHQYEKPEAGEDGGFEFEWILKEKPDTNVLTATVQTKGLDFFYQPALTQEEIDEGSQRPENVIGSYAVYHKTKGGMNSAAGMEYKTGKAFHIYRPKAIDANGIEVWAELNIDEQSGILSVTVPQKFLNDAEYPVKIDPTFGYTTIGGTTVAGNIILGSNGTSGSDAGSANLDSISVYGERAVSDGDIIAALYSGGTLLVNESVATSFTSTTQWWVVAMNSYSLSASTEYNLVTWTSGNTFNYRVDTVTDRQRSKSGLTYPTWPDPVTFVATVDRLYSIYATYTASGSSIKTFNGLAYASVKTKNNLAIASVKTYNGLA